MSLVNAKSSSSPNLTECRPGSSRLSEVSMIDPTGRVRNPRALIVTMGETHDNELRKAYHAPNAVAGMVAQKITSSTLGMLREFQMRVTNHCVMNEGAFSSNGASLRA